MTDSVYSNPTRDESLGQQTLLRVFANLPIAESEALDNLGLFVRRQTWGRYMFLMEIYRRMLPVHGVIMEFGVRWGQNMALFTSFRSVFEPFNYNRRVIGFDTFEGFPGVDAKDGNAREVAPGNYSVARGYEEHLSAILVAHEQQAPLPHIQKFELVKGDVTETLDRYLVAHPETIVAMAYFDLDLYGPTRHCLERVLPLMPKGAVLAFDELNYERFPGETVAVKEIMPVRDIRLERLPCSPLTSFAVLE